jgi:hypothetical protein
MNSPTKKVTITATPMMAFHGLSLLLLWLMVMNFYPIYKDKPASDVFLDN